MFKDFLFIIVLLVATGCDLNPLFDAPKAKCFETKKVVKIESIGYRTAMLILEDDRRVKVSKPKYTILVGSDYCIVRGLKFK
jgi:hypothetical protein